MTLSPEDKYFTVSSDSFAAEIKVKGSRFIGHIYHVANRFQAESVYYAIRRKYHDATHNCFAYRISADEFRYSDDGEPSGTAGIPIYQVIESNKLIQTIIIVTRYFGGTKLGTGGLRRAYLSCAREILSKTKIEMKVKYKTITVEAGYDTMNLLLDIINRFSGIIGKSQFTDAVSYSIQIPASLYDAFKEDIIAVKSRGIQIVNEN